ncbi:Inactive hydroxysteroid dehydrogenase-like protein 1 [Mactra antiquata]
MAAIDRFDFLLREILQTCSNIRDVLAFLGAFYAAKRTLRMAANIFDSLNVHLLSRISPNCNLAEKFGEWAGTRVWIFGMVERKSNAVILYPVEERKRETLIPLIKIMFSQTPEYV